MIKVKDKFDKVYVNLYGSHHIVLFTSKSYAAILLYIITQRIWIICL